ncbi:NRAMP family divalent metal transporter [Massilia sp. BJB1822]|uniref:NRAMP family divalent metal transporter n=1 Tax=Massilia sp. BJB1822 TaxID=2744470 RepID=UPI00159370A7|nr:divalent metal cation transporter [Massilia sp. BJB1822]NVE01870.1 divalent metal cation transporter [Massilia sp. BJB1822]
MTTAPPAPSAAADTPKGGAGLLGQLGPGLITGAADDDPSGIATYSQAGAQFGFGLLWTMLLTYPLMVGIQMASASIGRVSGRGLAGNMRRHCPPWLLHSIVLLLLLANTINIAADIAAMGEAARLVLGGRPQLYALGFGLLSLLLQLLLPYQRYARLLKWLTLALLAYMATVLVVQVPWGAALRAALLPQLVWERGYLTTVVALFGTTISPYLFFWQAAQEVEELRADPAAAPLRQAPQHSAAELRRIRLDTLVGMGFSNLVALSIMLTTAVTLHAQGVRDISSSAQAAAALRPLAGELAFALFSLGIIGTGLLAIPVLAGSAAYAVAGAFNWRSSLELRPRAARKFYAIIAAATLAGVGIGFLPIDPIQALYWSAVINGVIAVPIMAVTMLLASRPAVMGPLPLAPWLRVLGWLCTAAMALAVLAMLLTSG